LGASLPLYPSTFYLQESVSETIANPSYDIHYFDIYDRNRDGAYQNGGYQEGWWIVQVLPSASTMVRPWRDQRSAGARGSEFLSPLNVSSRVRM